MPHGFRRHFGNQRACGVWQSRSVTHRLHDGRPASRFTFTFQGSLGLGFDSDAPVNLLFVRLFIDDGRVSRGGQSARIQRARNVHVGFAFVLSDGSDALPSRRESEAPRCGGLNQRIPVSPARLSNTVRARVPIRPPDAPAPGRDGARRRRHGARSIRRRSPGARSIRPGTPY